MSLLISYKTCNGQELNCTSNERKFFYKHAKNNQKNYLSILINEYFNQVITHKNSFKMVLTHILS